MFVIRKHITLILLMVVCSCVTFWWTCPVGDHIATDHWRFNIQWSSIRICHQYTISTHSSLCLQYRSDVDVRSTNAKVVLWWISSFYAVQMRLQDLHIVAFCHQCFVRCSWVYSNWLHGIMHNLCSLINVCLVFPWHSLHFEDM